MIDRVVLQDEMRQYADDLILETIGEEEIAMFTANAKNIVEYAFEDYVNEQYHLYYDRVKPEKKLEFSNFTSGYVAQMNKWVSENGINIEPVKLENPKTILDGQSSQTKHDYNYLGIAVGGTVLSAGILLLPKVLTLPAYLFPITRLVAAAIEIIALGLAYRSYKNSRIDKSSPNNEHDSDKENMESELDILKEQLICGVWSQLDSWLDTAVEKSDSLINQYIYD